MLLDKDSQDTAKVGVAWKRDNGSISLRLNIGVVLSYDNMKGKLLTLFPIRTPEEWEAFHAQRKPQQPKNNGYPLYVRKVHFAPATRSECPNRAKAKSEITNDPSKVTCRLCREIAYPKDEEIPFTLPTAKTPEEPPPSAA